jgi:predicted MFS family arabinose efflux permease
VATRIPAERQGRALAAISSGTGWGVAASVPIALLAGDWRAAWICFAAVAAAVGLVNARILPARGGGALAAAPRLTPSWLVCPRSGPLLAGAFLVGLGSSVYWTFAVDFTVREGGHSAADGQLLLLIVGIASIGGTLAGDMIRRLGAPVAFGSSVAALVASVCLLSAAPSSAVAIAVSGVMFGAAYNLVIAIQVIWGAQVFSQRPSGGLGAVMFALGVGLLAGPAIGGPIADATGLGTVLYGAAGAIALVALLAPREPLGRPAAARSETLRP